MQEIRWVSHRKRELKKEEKTAEITSRKTLFSHSAEPQRQKRHKESFMGILNEFQTIQKVDRGYNTAMKNSKIEACVIIELQSDCELKGIYEIGT